MMNFEVKAFADSYCAFVLRAIKKINATNLMKAVLLALTLFLAAYYATAQQSVLLLEMSNPNKNVYYEVGDQLTFYLSGKRSKRTETILALEDSLVVFREYTAPVGQITALHIDDRTRWWLRYKPAQLALIAGTGYLVLDTVNNRELNEGTLAIGGSLIGLGLVFRLLIPNKIEMRRNTKLRILTV